MIDLDKARAARRAIKGNGPVVRINGAEFQLAPELPFTALESLKGLGVAETAGASMVDLCQALLGEHYESIRADLSLDDLNELVSGIMEAYGVSAPLG